MVLSRSDEIDLLTALYEGMFDEPRWSTFLARIRRRTRADTVSLIFGQGDAPIHGTTQWFAGHDVQAKAQALGELAALDPTPYHRLRPGRVYSATELVDPDDPRHGRFRRDYLARIGVEHGRFMRVTEPGGRSAWLSLTRAGGDFDAADSALLSALAPHLAIALRMLGELEATRFHAAAADDALARAGIGWTALDRESRIVDGGGLQPPRDALGLRALTRLAQGDAAAEDPSRDLLAVPVPGRPAAASAMPATIVLTRAPPALKAPAVAALARLFGLSPSEARLAARLASGRSLAEAATDLGLTIETARNYSKRLFAKTGTHGQPALIRRVLTSVATLA